MYSVLIEKLCSVFVVLLSFWRTMYLTINFYAETQRRTIEIKYIGSETMLLAESVSFKADAGLLPY
jgi:hypothetical protein